MNMTPEILEFAHILLEEVRDAAISSCDNELHPDAKSPIAKRWRAARAISASELARVMVSDCVDKAIFQLLAAIDGETLKLSFVASSGKTVDLTAEGLGELGGWFMGSGGWRAMFAKERFVDDFADLLGEDGA